MYGVGEKLKVFIEFPDGRVIDMNAIAVEYTVNNNMIDVSILGGGKMEYIPGMTEYEMRLVGTGEPTMSMKDFSEKKTWTCAHCDMVNDRKGFKGASKAEYKYECVKCGAPMPHIYRGGK